MPLQPRIAPIESLKPQEVMGRNGRCWCGSGDKWKACHRNRHLEPRPSYHEVKPGMAKLFAKGECGHPDAPKGCSGEAINSHTLQKGGALAALAENGHVISARQATQRLFQNKGRLVPQKTGVNSASTFPGFCNAHDTAFFLPIESGVLPLTRASAFLLSYRAMAYERHTKTAGLAGLSEMRRKGDAGLPFSAQVDVQQGLHHMTAGMRLGLEDLRVWKNQLDQMYRSGDTSDIGLMAVTFEGVLPFVAAFGKLPTVDFQGLKRQSLMSRNVPTLSLTVTVAAGRTIAIFSWFDGPKSAGAKMAESFSNVGENEKPSALLRYCLSSSENIHMRPSWWDGLTMEDLSDADVLIHMGLPLSDEGDPAHFVVGKGPLSLAPMASEVVHL